MEGGAKYVHSLAYLQLLPAVKEEKKNAWKIPAALSAS